MNSQHLLDYRFPPWRSMMVRIVVVVALLMFGWMTGPVDAQDHQHETAGTGAVQPIQPQRPLRILRREHGRSVRAGQAHRQQAPCLPESNRRASLSAQSEQLRRILLRHAVKFLLGETFGAQCRDEGGKAVRRQGVCLLAQV
jgi:hypothetical protein